MKRKTGLDGSLLFDNPSKPQEVKPALNDSVDDLHPTPSKKQGTFTRIEEIRKKANSEQKRTDVQLYSRTDVQNNKRTDVQVNKRTNVQDFRPVKRNAYSLYVDQIHFIEDEVIKRSRQTGKSVGISEVMRDIVAYYVSKKKK